jgi:hypothetical protein
MISYVVKMSLSPRSPHTPPKLESSPGVPVKQRFYYSDETLVYGSKHSSPTPVVVLENKSFNQPIQFVNVDVVVLYNCTNTDYRFFTSFINCNTVVIVDGEYEILDFYNSDGKVENVSNINHIQLINSDVTVIHSNINSDISLEDESILKLKGSYVDPEIIPTVDNKSDIEDN